MSYTDFKKKVCEHLASYMPDAGKPGNFNGKGTYPYIVDIPGKSQREIIEIILQDDKVKDVKEFPKAHRYAHHLNSSQIVCYEFFRGLLKLENGRIITNDEKMQPVLKAMGVNEALFQGAKAEFEKVFNDGEKTNFDFYLESTNQKNHLYIEVKYTEQGFGTCKNDDSHKNNFEKVYLKGISNSICLNDNAKKMKGKKDFPIMRKNYQLFRNILRVNSNNDYVVFLYPKANSIAESQFNKFKEKYISKQMSSHVLKAHWENFKQLMSPRFREKFFEYDK